MINSIRSIMTSNQSSIQIIHMVTLHYWFKSQKSVSTLGMIMTLKTMGLSVLLQFLKCEMERLLYWFWMLRMKYSACHRRRSKMKLDNPMQACSSCQRKKHISIWSNLKIWSQFIHHKHLAKELSLCPLLLLQPSKLQILTPCNL